jgi:hypothetical protein
MPIVYRNVPSEVEEAVRNGVKLLASKCTINTPLFKSAIAKNAVAPVPEQAFPVYYLGLSDIAKNLDINASIQTGWRYTLKQNDVILAHAQTVIDPNGKNVFSAINEGPMIEGTTKAIAATENLSEMNAGNFEVRLLFIPALHVITLWLVDENGKNDFTVPIEPTPASLTPNKLLPLNDFLTIIQREAKTTLEAYSGKEKLVS